MTQARFGQFEFFPATGELLRDGVPVRLQPQPAKVLALLISRAGVIVTRDDLQREVWGEGTHVDFERGLNYCVAQIRTALKDLPEAPRYVETIPRQGYRFIAPVIAVPRQTAKSRPHYGRYLAAAALVLTIGLAASRLFAGPPTIVVIPFYNETGKAENDPVAAALGDAVVSQLAVPAMRRELSVIGNAPSLRHPFARQDVQEISRKLGARYLIIGQLKADGDGMRLIAHFIRASDMKHLWANTYDDARFSLEVQGRTAGAIAAAIVNTVP